MGVSAASVMWLSGCGSTGDKKEAGPVLPPALPPKKAVAAQVRSHIQNAEALYRRGFYDEALAEIAKAMPLEPRNERLRSLFYEIQANQIAQRAREVAQESKISEKRAMVEIESNKLVPLSYSQRKPVAPEPDDTKTPLSAMEQVLQKPVTLHIDGGALEAVLLRLGQENKVNIIADPASIQGKTVTLHVDNVPLKEVFDFITRNQQVSFFVGENVIWLTQQDPNAAQPTTPFETRIYHLRQAVNFLGDESQQQQAGGAGGGQQLGGGGTARAAQGILGAVQQQITQAGAQGASQPLGQGPTTLEQAIMLFVPQPPGSALLFDRPSHTLLSKNTRENNALIEKIMQNLDISSKQILIEARFITIGVDDLAELGIDFALNSPYAVSSEKGQPKTVVDTGDIIKYGAFPNVADGLNLSYSGILTDPMFKAVLHALDSNKKANTISTPRVTTVNNREAYIRIGEDFRYFDNFSLQQTVASTSATTGQTLTQQIVPTGTPALEELGIELRVMPSVGANSQNIMMVLNPSISEFLRYETFQTFQTGQGGTGTGTGTAAQPGEIRLPIFSRSLVTSKAIVRSGETVVLGGLIKGSLSKERREPPIVGKIPVVGKLFRHNITEEKKSNLLIFVTATLISAEGNKLIPTTPIGAVPAPAGQ